MGYASLKECVDALRAKGELIDIYDEVDPHLEAAELHRRISSAQGPAVHFARVKGTRFPMVSNLFGTPSRARFIFRDSLRHIDTLVRAKADPAALLAHPFRSLSALSQTRFALPKKVKSGPVNACEITVSQLPQLKCWPMDGGAFITLPQVYTEDPDRPGIRNSNLGMYRVQLGGNAYKNDHEVGMHYQLHRSIGVHHSRAEKRGRSLRVAVAVGGPPAMTLAAVMPLPEGLSEIFFAGILGRRRVRLARWPAEGRSAEPPVFHYPAEADFCLIGSIDPHETRPEGPFGDHLGYYSLIHPFPVMKVEKVFHREDAIWPFTVVGRPPQEDSVFGDLIHEMTGSMIPAVLPGVQAVHAVDATGVHPLLLAVGEERYQPYTKAERPSELLTQAHAILGQGQLSLAKYLMIVNHRDDPSLDIHQVRDFFVHTLERIVLQRDLHFITQTSIDTLDYSGDGLNTGSKVIMAATGSPRRKLADRLPELAVPQTFSKPRWILPGVAVVQAPPFSEKRDALRYLAEALESQQALLNDPQAQLMWLVLVDDAEFVSASLDNFLWITFTRSNPAVDIDGVGAFIQDKHWGCEGPLLIDARLKPHHAPPVESDPETARRVNRLIASNRELAKLLL